MHRCAREYERRRLRVVSAPASVEPDPATLWYGGHSEQEMGGSSGAALEVVGRGACSWACNPDAQTGRYVEELVWVQSLGEHTLQQPQHGDPKQPRGDGRDHDAGLPAMGGSG